MIPLLNRGGGPLLSSLPFEVSLRLLLAASSFVITFRFGFCDPSDFFVISDFSLAGVGDAYLDELPLLTRIFLTVLLDVDDMIEAKEMTGPRTSALLGVFPVGN